MSSVLRPALRGVLSRPLKGLFGILSVDTDDTLPSSGGSFSSAFSAAFDLNIQRKQFSSAFSSAFAIFSRRKEFSSAFSDAFTNNNI